MDKNKIKQAKRLRRRGRVRAKVLGTAGCPRLTVFRSNRAIYAQIINDEIGRTLAAVGAGEVYPVKSPLKRGAEQFNGVNPVKSTLKRGAEQFNGVNPAKGAKAKSKKVDIGFQLGKLIAQKALAKGILKVVFDRNGYKYHGRVKALAQGARAAGLKF